mmetsp:Transcript_23316/g.38861  ORF Transcript_23316/g.38861 Transcript_23316/m.38861 type:complete len:137 (-) Transcript_23316:55-465(-)
MTKFAPSPHLNRPMATRSATKPRASRFQTADAPASMASEWCVSGPHGAETIFSASSAALEQRKLLNKRILREQKKASKFSRITKQRVSKSLKAGKGKAVAEEQEYEGVIGGTNVGQKFMNAVSSANHNVHEFAKNI